MPPKRRADAPVAVKKAAVRTVRPKASKGPPSSDSDVEIVEPAPKRKTPVKKAAVKPKVAPKPKPAPKVVKPPPTWDEVCTSWFNRFAEEGTASPRIDGEGIERLCAEMNIGMDGVAPFLLAYELKATVCGSFRLDEWLHAFRAPGISTSSALKERLAVLEASLYPQATSSLGGHDKFKAFYTYVFNLMRDEGQKSLAGEIAVAVWGVVLVPKFPLAQEWCDYCQSLSPQLKGISSDVWSQLLDFCKLVGQSEALEGYGEDEAWPSLIDSFVEWKRGKLA